MRYLIPILGLPLLYLLLTANPYRKVKEKPEYPPKYGREPIRIIGEASAFNIYDSHIVQSNPPKKEEA